MPEILPSQKLWKLLVAAGVIQKDDRIRRLVLDVQVHHVPMLYLERVASDKLSGQDFVAALAEIQKQDLPPDPRVKLLRGLLDEWLEFEDHRSKNVSNYLPPIEVNCMTQAEGCGNCLVCRSQNIRTL